MSDIDEIVLEDRSRTPPPPRLDRKLARSHTLRELRALCAKHRISISGTKHELAARIVSHIEGTPILVGR